jgi:hypothetical protein
MTRRKTSGLAVLIVAVVGAVVWYRWPQDDRALAAAIVGSWQAVDPTNNALHKRQEGVDIEKAVFQADGKLTYILESKSKPNTSKREPWGWKVQKGRLSLRYAGEDSAQEWLGSIPFTVTSTTLSIERKGFPVKEFTRIGG